MSAPRITRRSRKLLVPTSAVILVGVLMELFFRSFGASFGVPKSRIWEVRSFVCYGQARLVPKAFVGWSFSPHLDGVDESGFLSDTARPETEGTLRIACLGGSTTAGNVYLGYEGSYPGQLQAHLRTIGRDARVMNYGVPGWSSANSLVNYVLHVQDERPHVVVIHHAVNDVFPRLQDGFRSDYSHYVHSWESDRFSWIYRFLIRWSDIFTAVQARGWDFTLDEHVSTPMDDLRMERPQLDRNGPEVFRRNLDTLQRNVRLSGGKAVLMTMPFAPRFATPDQGHTLAEGIEQHNEVMRELARREDLPLFDFARFADARLGAEFVDIVHMSVEGYRIKAQMLADFLEREGLLTPELPGTRSPDAGPVDR